LAISTRSTGNLGERIACQFLQSKGYTILEQNWRFKHLELDIICQTGDFLVFVEVKYRKNVMFGEPIEFITGQKMQNLSQAAAVYVEEKGHQGWIRFDIIGIRPDAKARHYKIRHLKDIHYSGWDP